MMSKIVIMAMFCVACTLAEAPANRYRYQRLRQTPSTNSFQRQETAPYPGPYPAANEQPEREYGPPAASNGDTEVTEADSETIDQPSRFTAFNAAPAKKSPQKLSQRLELQQEVKQSPRQHQQFLVPDQQIVTPIQSLQSVAVAAPLQLAAIQREGSYFIQLPNGSLQRVNYLTQPSVSDGSVFAKLQYRPVAELQTIAEPQLFVNTVVQSHVSTDEEQN